jgi:hypothetical protein
VSDVPNESQKPVLEVATPDRFGSKAVARVNMYGLVLTLPVLIAVILMSAMPFGILAALLPLLAILGGAFFLPFGFGNRYIVGLVKSRTGEEPGPNQFIVQVTLTPRIHGGIRGLLEDADDIGVLYFHESEFVFKGDSINLRVPFRRIVSVTRKNLGLRGLYVYGNRIAAEFEGLAEVREVAFAERASSILPASWRITKLLNTKMQDAMEAGKSDREKNGCS